VQYEDLEANEVMMSTSNHDLTDIDFSLILRPTVT